MSQISIKMDKAQWNHIRASLRKMPEKMGDVVSDAVFKTTNHVRTRMDAEARSVITAPKKTLHVAGSQRRFITQGLWGFGYKRAGRVTARGARIPLAFFKAQPRQLTGKGKTGGKKRIGVTFQTSKMGGRKTEDHRLFMHKGSKRPSVLLRVAGVSRYPVLEAFGPSVLQVLESIGAIPKIEKAGMDFMEKRIMQQLDRKLGRN